VQVRVVATFARRRKRVVIRDPEEESTAIIPVDTKSKDKGKGIMVEEPKPMKKKKQFEMDEEYARKLHEELNKDIDWDVSIDHVKQKAKEDSYVQRYQVMKKRPQIEAKARRNMIMYLKNVAGFRLDYFKGMSYDNILIATEHAVLTGTPSLTTIDQDVPSIRAGTSSGSCYDYYLEVDIQGEIRRTGRVSTAGVLQ
nr:hypothetical protein [Tanacetum cinerariifolium]